MKRERPTLRENQRFEDIGDAEVDVLTDPIPIKDSKDAGEDTGGFVVLPTKIPLGAIIVFIVQCIITAISITSIYVEQKTNTLSQNDKITRLEASCYTAIEARYLEKEVTELKTLSRLGK